MQPLPECYSLRTALLFSPHASPQENKWINIRDGKIASIGKATEGAHYDVGNCAVLPGLVNAHAHLEFSDLESPLGTRGEPLTDWIGEVFAYRSGNRRQTAEDRISTGIDQSTAAGVVAIADIVSEGKQNPGGSLHYVAFEEIIAASDAQQTKAMQQITGFSPGIAGESNHGGLSPHAPYSVAAPIWNKAIACAREKNFPLAVHLAETRDELSFLAHGAAKHVLCPTA